MSQVYVLPSTWCDTGDIDASDVGPSEVHRWECRDALPAGRRQLTKLSRIYFDLQRDHSSYVLNQKPKIQTVDRKAIGPRQRRPDAIRGRHIDRRAEPWRIDECTQLVLKDGNQREQDG